MSKAKQHIFTAEVEELLHLLTHSLYSNPEIFLRELISNASDAIDKLKILSLTDAQTYQMLEPKISIEVDEAAKTIKIYDNGIGMSEEEIMENLGKLARSGTKKFLQQFQNSSGDNKKELIGQFGVGFYSAFVVADKVEVYTRRADKPSSEAVLWVSDGKGTYELAIKEKEEPGTSILLHLKDTASEFAALWRIKQIITKYSDYIKFPIYIKKDAEANTQENTEDKPAVDNEWEMVNKAVALWTLSKSEISDEDYKKLYKEISYDYEDPLLWTHNKVEGINEYTILLYIPRRAPFDLWQRDMKKGVKLFANRVYIMDGVDAFLPNYLRFIKGVVDANNLPLNVSREILQKNETVDVIKQACTKRCLDMIEYLSKDTKEYKIFWEAFGSTIKEGVIEDFANLERLQQLLRFKSTKEEITSLDAYVERMKNDQKIIYYLTSDSHVNMLSSPHLDWFKKEDIEVLLMSDRIDEWLSTRMTKYKDFELKSITENDLGLPSPEDDVEVVHDTKSLIDRLKEFYKDKVSDVVENKRLTSSPVCLVKAADQLAPHLVKMLKEAGQAVPEQKFTLGINPKHRLILKMLGTVDQNDFENLARILLSQAILLEGGTLDHPHDFIQAVNDLI